MNNKDDMFLDHTRNENYVSLEYSGPSFEKGFEMKELSGNLKSIYDLIEAIFDIAKEEGISQNNSSDVKNIYFQPEYGSFIENIRIELTKPETISLVRNILIAGFFYLLTKYDQLKQDERISERTVKKLLSSHYAEKWKKLYDPIRKSKENILSLRTKTTTYTLAKYEDINKIDAKLKEIEEEEIEEIEENTVRGYISSVNIDTNHFKFHPHGDTRAYKLLTSKSARQMAKRIGKKESYLMRIVKVDGQIKRFEMIDKSKNYKLLNEF